MLFLDWLAGWLAGASSPMLLLFFFFFFTLALPLPRPGDVPGHWYSDHDWPVMRRCGVSVKYLLQYQYEYGFPTLI